ncbi:putative toxin-antitoxin system toxin component, PIN family [Dyadobacter sp. OTU695]|uniref:putative toxin-antitoxin system toxin component, PIN family n=1 Tax=Dyadobacter sp. OTU695 TaxID=3043860 RepID=UPI00313DB433
MTISRFIFDTNTLISAFLLEGGTTSLALTKAMNIGKVITTQVIKRELADVFLRSKFDKYVSFEKRVHVLGFLDEQFEMWPEPEERVEICRDPKDNKFLELAALGNAVCIITGDEDLLVLNPFRNTTILNSRDFLTHF